MILPILIWPHPKLKDPSADLSIKQIISNPIKELVANMLETVQSARGLGLSAIQVGHPVRLFVTDIAGTQHIYFNPVIEEWIGEAEPMTEGCLSLPGVFEEVLRFSEVVISFQNHLGEVLKHQLGGLEAQCAQHEYDHLDGLLMTDDLGPVKRDIVKRKIAKELKRRAR